MAETSKKKKPSPFVRIKNYFGSKIRNAKTLAQKKKPEKLNAKLGSKNERQLLKLVRSYNKSLMPVYLASRDVNEIAEQKLQTELKKFDLKQNWKYRQANHAYAKSLFADVDVAQAKQTLDVKLAELGKAREEKLKVLTAAKEKYLAAHTQDESARKAAAEEYEQKLEAAQKDVDETYERLLAERRTRVQEMHEKCAAKIAEINGKTAEELDLPDDVVLSVRHLCMYFGGLHAVEDLSFDVKKGEIFGLIGPNGAGKTTVFNCITQFYKSTAGDILFRNNEGIVIDLKKKVVHDVILEGVARTFQNVEVIKEVSVLENLLVAATRKYAANLAEQTLNLPILSTEEKLLKEKALNILAYFDLLAYKDWLAWGLPYGILKKVEIARALMADPKLLILDEPAAGLNNTETAQLAKLIVDIRDKFGCSILLVEHDMSLVMSICDRICAISFGRMLALGTPDVIQSDKQVQEAYLGVADEEPTEEQPVQQEQSTEEQSKQEELVPPQDEQAATVAEAVAEQSAEEPKAEQPETGEPVASEASKADPKKPTPAKKTSKPATAKSTSAKSTSAKTSSAKSTTAKSTASKSTGAKSGAKSASSKSTAAKPKAKPAVKKEGDE